MKEVIYLYICIKQQDGALQRQEVKLFQERKSWVITNFVPSTAAADSATMRQRDYQFNPGGSRCDGETAANTRIGGIRIDARRRAN